MTGHIVINIDALDSFIESMESSLSLEAEGPMQEAASEAMDVYMQGIRDRFAISSERGGDWAEHAPRTIRRRGVGAPILNETGQLEASLERGAAGHVLEFTEDTVIEGTADRTARFHQDGDEDTNLPARTILVAPDAGTLTGMKEQLVSGFRITILNAAHG